MTDNSDKIRALVLAALMVFSVFAGTVAFAGTAAAASAGTWSASSADDVTLGQSSTSQTLVVDYSIDSEGTENVTLDLSGYQSQIDFNSFSASTDADNVTVENENLDTGANEFTFDLNNTEAASNSGNLTIEADLDTTGASTNSGTSLTITAEDDAGSDSQFQFDVVNPTDSNVRKATHYVSDSDGAIIEVAFDKEIDPSGETFEVGFDDGDVQDFSATSDGNGRVIIDTSGTVYSNVRNVTVPSTLVDGSDDVTVDVTFAPTTVNAGDNIDNGYIGSNVAFEAGSTDTTIDFDGPSFSPTRGTGAGSHVYVVDTDNFDAGTYNGTFSDATSDTVGTVELTSLGLDVTANDVTTDSAVTATVESNDINRDVDVNLLNSDDEVVASTTVAIDSDGQATADFGSQDAGNYSVVATDVSTEVEATDSVTVTEAATGEVTFGQSNYEVPQGGVAEITLEITGTTEGSLVIGQDSNSGYQANVTFTDENEDGEVTILFNTYTAGDTDMTIVTAKGDDTASIADGDTNLGDGDLLAQGGYDLAAVQGTYTDGSAVFENGDSEFSSLAITERSTDSMQLWTAPDGTESDALLDSVTQDTTIAQDDWIVHQVTATGLEGLINAEGNFSAALESGLNVSVQQTEATTRQNRAPKSLNMTEAVADDDIALIADAESNSYYIALDTGTDAFERGDGTGSNADGLSASANEDYTAVFTVDDTKLVGADAEDHESVNATFEVVAPTASLDETPVSVTASSSQMITGSSTLAPGTEVTVTVQSTGDTSPRFYNNPTATVQDDGTWNVTVDFSEQSAGDTFTVSSDYFSADGEVVESTTTETAEPTPTATAEPTPTATAEPTPTATAEPTPTATDEPAEPTPTATDEPTEEPTTTTTPGFGVAVALVALLAAALLAGRRE